MSVSLEPQNEIESLLERLEKATGPDRELDYTIAEWLNPWLVECDYRRLDGDNGWQTETPLVKGANNVAPASAYTASLDAARSLGGMIVYASDIGADGLALVKLVFDTTKDPIVEYTGIHSRIEIAYVIAALNGLAAERDLTK